VVVGGRRSASFGEAVVPGQEEADQYRIYERVPPEKPYGDLETMLRAEIGVGKEESIARVQAMAEKAEQGREQGNGLNEQEIGKGKPGPGRGCKTGNVITCFNRGVGSSYLSARIARDRSDILERMKAGEFRSVRQAAIAAGIVKVPTTLDQCQRAYDRLGAEERAEFLRRNGLTT